MTTYKYTIPSLFKESVKNYPENTSLIFAGEKNYTYRQMGEDAGRLAGLLTELGVSKGDKVAILSSNMPNWGVAFFAISLTGATVVPILPDFHENEIKSILMHSGAKVMFISESLYKSISQDTTGLLEKLILIESFSVIPAGTKVEDLGRLKCSITDKSADFQPVDVDEEDLASLIYTSGTTGSSKGVMLTHKNIVWTVEKCYTLQDINENDRFLSVLPL
ncbi:MAG: AMP-binding protein, partial [Prolixibacteraceae bacterium]|nr:AMP-binding protein [Prolixibacteraceae bacterium]